MGSNFVRWVVRGHPEVGVAVLDKLANAGNRENIVDLLGRRVGLVVGDICDEKLLDCVFPCMARLCTLPRSRTATAPS